MALLADAPTETRFRLTFSADPLVVRRGMARIAASLPMAALAPDHRARAEIALAEVLNNIAEHAYAKGPGKIAVRLRVTASGLDCRFSDHGREMPGGDLPQGQLPREEYPEGGFGWYLIRSLTQGLDYRRVNGRNRLRFLIPG